MEERGREGREEALEGGGSDQRLGLFHHIGKGGTEGGVGIQTKGDELVEGGRERGGRGGGGGREGEGRRVARWKRVAATARVEEEEGGTEKGREERVDKEGRGTKKGREEGKRGRDFGDARAQR